MHEPIITQAKGPQKLERLLNQHPFVKLTAFQVAPKISIQFERNGWERTITQGIPKEDEPYGLIEVMDNNPLVCADHVGLPGPAATLALIAFAPLIRAGVLNDVPAIAFSFEDDFTETEQALKRENWQSGVAITGESQPIQGRLVATAICQLEPNCSVNEIDEIYKEAYHSKIYVKRQDNLEGRTAEGKPEAFFKLSYPEPNNVHKVLRVDTVADADGKCGSAQAVHILNIMAGFEETLGI